MHNVLFLAWNTPKQGREGLAGELFASSIGYWTEQQKAGKIDSFEPVLLSQHGGDMNGFFIIKGEGTKLHELTNSEEFTKLAMQMGFALDGFGLINGWHGDELMNIMGKWTEMTK